MIDFLLNCIECITYFLFFYIFLNRLNYNKILSILLLFIEASLYTIILLCDLEVIIADLFILFLIILFQEILFYDHNASTKLMIATFTILLSFIHSILGSLISIVFMPFIKHPYPLWIDAISSFHHILCLILFYFLAKYMRKKAQFINKKLTEDFLLILFLPSILQYSIYVMYIHNPSSDYVILFILSTFLNILMLVNLYKKLKDREEILKTKMTSTLIQASQNQFNLMIKNEESLRHMRHDLKNHLIVIQSLNENGNQKELSNYLNKIMKHFNNPQPKIYCQNLYLNTLINSKINEFPSIHFNIFITSDLTDFIDEMDLTILVSNLLDNAITEIIQHPKLKKEIELKMYEKNAFQIITIENPLSQQKSLETEKTDSSMHGLGLNIIQNIVNKYDGKMNINQSDSFKVSILLCCEEKTQK